MTDAYGPGFRTVEREYRDHTPPIEGTIPDWLSGVLVRNGPGRFEMGGERVNHWFDGLAMLRRYAFENGELRYTNRFLRTGAYEDAMAGRASGQFATDSRDWRRVLSWLRTRGPQPTDNANVHVARLSGEYVALTEAPRRVAFDPDTLETTGEFDFDDDITEHMTAAHLTVDPHRGETVGFATEFGLDPKIHVYRVADGESRRHHVASIPARGPGYIHDCSVTADHVVLVEPPLDIEVWRALVPWTEGVFDLLSWNPDRGARVVVLDRESGDVLRDTEIDPVFVFHHVNAYTEEGAVVLDAVDFPDASIVGSMSLEKLDGPGFPDVPDGRLARYRINLDGGAVTREQWYDGGIELPRVPERVRGQRHRYAYAQTTDRTGANGIVKLDVERGSAREYAERSTFFEEPVPVQHPDADGEDDGVVLATALDVDRERSSLFVFDAATLAVRARAPLPHAEPFGFHGRFFRET